MARMSSRSPSNGRPVFFSTCECCGSQFQFGADVYDGKKLPAYDMMVCMGCYQANWDGWAPHYEPKILAHLEAKGIPVPERNAQGWLPRGG
jgi:hypothetical protein